MVVEIPKAEDLDWVKLRQDMDGVMNVEPTWDKAIRKFKASPFIPIGVMATVTALSVGLYSFLKGRSQMSQYMMRARVAAQGFTVVAIVVSLSSVIPKQNEKKD